jgi:hypothetical protein
MKKLNKYNVIYFTNKEFTHVSIETGADWKMKLLNIVGQGNDKI